MSRELAEVRRYWPRTRYAGYDWHGWQSEDDPGVLYMRYSSERRWWRKRCELCLDEEQGGWRVTDSNWDQIGRGDTIAEAMRAAGFGVRPLSRFVNGFKRNDCAGRILPGCRIHPHKWFTPLADSQRPRKGARLGRRRREIASRSYIQQLEDCFSAIDSAAFYVMANTSVPVREVQP